MILDTKIVFWKIKSGIIQQMFHDLVVCWKGIVEK